MHQKKYKFIVLELSVGERQDPFRNGKKDYWDNLEIERKTAKKDCNNSLEMDLYSTSVEQWHIFFHI